MLTLLLKRLKPVVRESLNDRRRLMHETFIEVPNQFVFARYMDSSDLEEIRLFLDQSVKDSCEGLMVKIMDGPESFYEPSQRSRNWLKVSCLFDFFDFFWFLASEQDLCQDTNAAFHSHAPLLHLTSGSQTPMLSFLFSVAI